MSNTVRGHVLGLADVNIFSSKTVGGPARPDAIEDMDRELTRVIEDFDRAVNVEALRLAKETGKHVLAQYGKSSLSLVTCRTTVSA